MISCVLPTLKETDGWPWKKMSWNKNFIENNKFKIKAKRDFLWCKSQSWSALLQQPHICISPLISDHNHGLVTVSEKAVCPWWPEKCVFQICGLSKTMSLSTNQPSTTSYANCNDFDAIPKQINMNLTQKSD